MNKDLKKYLDSKKCFKLILGANNENYDEITKLTALYSLAGCRFFDLNPTKEALDAAKNGLKFSNKDDCFLCASVCVDNDPHFKKCKINPLLCKKCKKCYEVCIQKAIDKDCACIDEKKCIGCKKCADVCSNNAIEEYKSPLDWEKNFSLIKSECDCVEFHIASNNLDEIDEKWEFLCKNYDKMLSICTSRSVFSNNELIKQLQKMISKRDKNLLMIQADGAPMTGGCDDYRSTLQAVAAADIIDKAKFNIPLIMSGGTNSKTYELAKLCEIDVSGVAIGSYARKIVKDYIERKDFLSNEAVFNEALEIAKKLINSVN